MSPNNHILLCLDYDGNYIPYLNGKSEQLFLDGITIRTEEEVNELELERDLGKTVVDEQYLSHIKRCYAFHIERIAKTNVSHLKCTCGCQKFNVYIDRAKSYDLLVFVCDCGNQYTEYI